MKEKSFMDIYLNQNILFRKTVDVSEWLIILLIALFFPNPSLKLPLFLNYILGLGFLTAGIYIHHLAHQVNPQAHFNKESITRLITHGIYSKIRHPCYSSYILAYIGAFFILRSLWVLIPVFIFSFLFYHSAIQEEKFLLKKFGQEYLDYMRKVPRRFFPYFF